MSKTLAPLRARISDDFEDQITLFQDHPERHAEIRWEEAKALVAESRQFRSRLILWMLSGNVAALLLASQALLNHDTAERFQMPLVVSLWLFLFGMLGTAAFAFGHGAYMNAEASVAAYAAMLQEKLRKRKKQAEARQIDSMVTTSVVRSVGMIVSVLGFVAGLAVPLILITLQHP